MKEANAFHEENMAPTKALAEGIRFVGVSAPQELLTLVFLNILGGAGPSALLYAGKLVIDEVTRIANLRGNIPTASSFDFSSSTLMWAVIGFICLNFILSAIYTLSNLQRDNLRERVDGSAQKRVLEKISTFDDISLFEQPQLLNIVQLAQKGISSLSYFADTLSLFMSGLFQLLPAIILTAALGWWVPILMLATLIPTILVRSRIDRHSWDIEASHASTLRERRLYEAMLGSPAYAKEVRLFRLQDFLLRRWEVLFYTIFDAMRRARRKGVVSTIAWSVIATFGVSVPYIYVINGALSGTLSLGDLALYAGLIFEIQASLTTLIYQSSEAYVSTLSFSPIFRLLGLTSQLSRQSAQSIKEDNIPKAQGIAFCNVSFEYPLSEQYALKKINLTVSPGETVSVVGENGAGKSTLAKLVCRLYDPTEGCITWNGRDIRSIELNDLRQQIVAVVQDFAKFHVSVRDNIGFGDLAFIDSDTALWQAAKSAGLKKKIESMPSGLDTSLGKMLDGGAELSGGQWQRLTIARAFLREASAELFVLDEPTSALDPNSEYETMETFRRLTTNKMAIVISHRMSSARLADRIVVVHGGEIVEEGTHEYLLSLKGRYYKMFTQQASGYQ